jgi:hypothetical protein
MNDWYNDPPDDQEPPEWYMALDDVLDSQRGDMPEEVEAAVRAAMHKWEEEYNAACSRPEPEQKDEEMPDPALFCQHCGNPNNNGCGLCNACGENAKCAHGNPVGSCDHCDHLADLAYDAARESRGR